MPFINVKTNTTILPEKEKIIKEKLGKCITLLEKTESWLMLNFEDNCRLWFKGDNKKSLAIAEISLFGKANKTAYDKMTEAVTDTLSSELNISSDCIYVKYDEIENWGWNGNNF